MNHSDHPYIEQPTSGDREAAKERQQAAERVLAEFHCEWRRRVNEVRKGRTRQAR
jgi:hypothetical protein